MHGLTALSPAPALTALQERVLTDAKMDKGTVHDVVLVSRAEQGLLQSKRCCWHAAAQRAHCC